MGGAGRGGAGGVFLERSDTHSANCAEDSGDSSGAVASDSVHRRRVLPRCEQRQDFTAAVLGQFVLRLWVAARRQVCGRASCRGTLIGPELWNDRCSRGAVHRQGRRCARVALHSGVWGGF